MTVIDRILRFFVSDNEECPIPPRLDKDQMAICLREARQIADDAARRNIESDDVHFCDPVFDPDRVCDEILKSTLRSPVEPLEEAESHISLSPKSTEPRRMLPNLHSPTLSFSARLLTYVNEKCGGAAPIAYKRAGVSRQVYSRIVSRDDSVVDKRTAMLFCIGLQLEIGEAELLLKSAGYAFSYTIPVDMVFSYCITHKIWNLKDINAILVKCGLSPATRERNPYK